MKNIMADEQERVYEVEIIYAQKAVMGVAIMSNKGITLKDDEDNIVTCYDTEKMQRNGDQFSDYNSDNRNLSSDQLDEYWVLNVELVQKMIKRGVFSCSTFNSVILGKLSELLGSNVSEYGSGYSVSDDSCPHYNG